MAKDVDPFVLVGVGILDITGAKKSVLQGVAGGIEAIPGEVRGTMETLGSLRRYQRSGGQSQQPSGE